MASIEQRGNTFRIVFRYGSRKFSRTLRTKDRKAADACVLAFSGPNRSRGVQS